MNALAPPVVVPIDAALGALKQNIRVGDRVLYHDRERGPVEATVVTCRRSAIGGPDGGEGLLTVDLMVQGRTIAHVVLQRITPLPARETAAPSAKACDGGPQPHLGCDP